VSAISEKVRTALFAKMNVTAVTSLATGGVHFVQAKEGTAIPYVVFTRLPVDVHYALANNLVGERDVWLIKALADKDSHSLKSAPSLAEDILTAIETAIGTTLTLTGNTVRRVRRVREIPNYTEKVTDRIIYHHGFHLEVFTD
jgi:hypothetical protein